MLARLPWGRRDILGSMDGNHAGVHVKYVSLKPGFHKDNFDHDNDQFSVKTKRLAGRMIAQPCNRFVFCVVVVVFVVNGNQAK